MAPAMRSALRRLSRLLVRFRTPFDGHSDDHYSDSREQRPATQRAASRHRILRRSLRPTEVRRRDGCRALASLRAPCAGGSRAAAHRASHDGTRSPQAPAYPEIRLEFSRLTIAAVMSELADDREPRTQPGRGPVAGTRGLPQAGNRATRRRLTQSEPGAAACTAAPGRRIPGRHGAPCAEPDRAAEVPVPGRDSRLRGRERRGCADSSRPLLR